MAQVLRLNEYRRKNSAHILFADCRHRFEVWLQLEEKAANTVKSYLNDLDEFAKWFKAGQQEQPVPEVVTATDLREFKRSLIERGYKPHGINRKLSTLSVYLKWALEQGLIQALPKIPKTVKEVSRPLRWLDRREQNSLLRAVERGGKVRDLAAIRLLLNTGLRASELVDLRWKDVSLSDRKGLLIVRSGKGGKRREVTLNADARSALHLLGYEEKSGTDTPVLIGQRGAVTLRGLQSLVEKYRNGKDLAGLTVHALRHTFCKNLVDAGVGLEQVAALAGHESLDTTRRYCQPSQADLQRSVDLIGEED